MGVLTSTEHRTTHRTTQTHQISIEPNLTWHEYINYFVGSYSCHFSLDKQNMQKTIIHIRSKQQLIILMVRLVGWVNEHENSLSFLDASSEAPPPHQSNDTAQQAGFSKCVEKHGLRPLRNSKERIFERKISLSI